MLSSSGFQTLKSIGVFDKSPFTCFLTLGRTSSTNTGISSNLYRMNIIEPMNVRGYEIQGLLISAIILKKAK